MADVADPWSPQEGAPQPSTAGAFLDDPRLRAALLQTGLNLMQPPSFGDTAASVIGRGIGGGAEAVGRQEAMNRAEAEAASKQDLRTAQAQRAEALSTAAGSQASAAQARLALGEVESQRKRDYQRAHAQIMTINAYEKYKKGIEDANAKASLVGGTVKPVLPMDQWLDANPPLKAALAIHAMSGPAGTTPTLSSTTLDDTEASRQAARAAGQANPSAKAAIKKKLEAAGIDSSGLGLE